MKIAVVKAQERTLVSFADEHSLNVVVREYPTNPSMIKWRAMFEPYCELIGAGPPEEVRGLGTTIDEAVKDMADFISEKRLEIIRNPGYPRETIYTDTLTYSPSDCGDSA